MGGVESLLEEQFGRLREIDPALAVLHLNMLDIPLSASIGL
jgi:hypothetical protein